MVKLIRDIEDKDRTFIIGANDILGEYNNNLEVKTRCCF